MKNPAINPPNLLNGFTEQLRDNCSLGEGGMAKVILRDTTHEYVKYVFGFGFETKGRVLSWGNAGISKNGYRKDMAEL
jgi:hypothetical protein